MALKINQKKSQLQVSNVFCNSVAKYKMSRFTHFLRQYFGEQFCYKAILDFMQLCPHPPLAADIFCEQPLIVISNFKFNYYFFFYIDLISTRKKLFMLKKIQFSQSLLLPRLDKYVPFCETIFQFSCLEHIKEKKLNSYVINIAIEVRLVG